MNANGKNVSRGEERLPGVTNTRTTRKRLESVQHEACTDIESRQVLGPDPQKLIAT
jgi:hypothetical protein